MRKAAAVLLVVLAAVGPVWANANGDGGCTFAVKADFIGLYGQYGVACRVGGFEFGLGYMTLSPTYAGFTFVNYLCTMETFEPAVLTELVYPMGAIGTVGYKFLATGRHELGAFVQGGYFVGMLAAVVGVEYDFCFSESHAVYAKGAYCFQPFFGWDGFYFFSDIGYRYTF